MMLLGPGKLGKYRLRRRIGVGGMAEIYEAFLGGAEGFAKRLALKVLLPDFQREPEVIKSFIDEARIAAQLTHPNIVSVFDFGQIHGTYYLAMEFVDGWDLRELIRRGRRGGQGLPVAAAAYVGHELAEALYYIHSRQQEIVHRDVTPSNVFITSDGHVKLGDFGVAKTEARLARTQEGQIKGKLAYLSPEQVRGDPVTNRTDIYAAGLILYEMLTGERYNDAGRDVDLLSNAMSPRMKLPSRRVLAARPLDEVVEGTLQPHSTMRTRDARLLAEQLGSYLQRDPWDADAMARLTLALAQETAQPQPPSVSGEASAGRPTPKTAPGATASGATPSGASASMVSIPTGATLQLPDERSLPRNRWPLWLAASVLLLLAAGITVLLWPNGDRAAGVAADVVEPGVPDATLARAIDRDVGRGADLAVAPDLASDLPSATVAADLGPDEGQRVTFAPVRIKRRKTRGTPPVRRARVAAARQRPVASGAPRSEDDGLLDPFAAKEPETRGRAEIKALLTEIDRRARTRGLFHGDDATYDRLWREAQRAVQRGTGEAEMQRLERWVTAFRPDSAFIRGKLARLERRIATARIDDTRRRSLTTRSQQILRLVLDDRVIEASRQISSLLQELK